jgi:hypothetical protein
LTPEGVRQVSRQKREDARHTIASPKSVSVRSGTEKRRKSLFIRARVTAAEKAAILAKAERAGLTEGAFVRVQCLDTPPKTRSIRRPPVEAADLSRLLGLLGNATGNLNQVSKHLNKGFEPTQADIDAALADVRRAAAEIMEVIGRRPKEG